MRNLQISCGASFFDAPALQTFTWSALVGLLGNYAVGSETLAEYLDKPKAEQLRLKDVGWYNGNHYSQPVREGRYITGVDLLTLDIDNGDAEITSRIVALLDPFLADDGFAYFLGSTRKHTDAKPRLRLVVPLSRTATVDEADALRRMVAFRVGMPACDTVSFRANQVMFWPSRSRDGAQYTQEGKGDWLDVDAALATWYPNGWTNRESWPLHPNEDKSAVSREQAKLGDPREKPGIIGLWCQTYSITDILTTFLADEYVPGSKEGRWTHVGGTAGDGAIVYGDDLWLYSHHQTDPGTGQSLNAWDLVRVHKFGHLDAKTSPTVQINNKPSTRAMSNFVQEVPEFKRALAESAVAEFKEAGALASAGKDEDAIALAERFTYDKKGLIEASRANLEAIISHLPIFAGALGFNVNAGMKVWRRWMPWHEETRKLQRMDETEGLSFADVDTLRTREWIEQAFRIAPIGLAMLDEVLALVADRNRFHPIRDYLRNLEPWDGKPRMETLFMRYLGVEDTAYHRATARMMMVAAVKRIMEPGCKFDNAVLIIGPERIRKSSFVEALAGHPAWFTDDIKQFDRDGVAAVKSVWFVELAELAALGANETEVVKAFLSRRVDRVRLAFERNVQSYPRQCVMVGTSNGNAPLRDPHGNGRYYPVWTVGYSELVRKIDIESLRAEMPQIHAEAYAAWQSGEAIHITNAEAAEQAHAAQEAARPEDPVIRAIDAWLDGEVSSRRSPFGSSGNEFLDKPQLRLKTCVSQIACEALGFSEQGSDWPRGLANRIVDHLHNRDDWGRSSRTERMKGYGKPRVYVRFENALPEPKPESMIASPTLTADDL